MADSMQWIEKMSSVFGLEVKLPSPRAAQSVDGDVHGAALGKVATFKIQGTPQALRRSPAAIKNAQHGLLKVCAMRAGRMLLLREGEADLTINPGDIAFYDTSRPYVLKFEGRWDCAVMTVPRGDLALPSRTLNSALRQNFPESGPGTVLTHLIESSIQEEAVHSETCTFLGNAAIDLLSGLVYEKSSPQAPDEVLRASIRSYIGKQLGDPELSVAKIAYEHGISVRSVHRLFQQEEHGIAELIRTLRLEALAKDLADPRFKQRGIMALGAKYAFQDQAHLTRLFRSYFGTTPAAFRKGSEWALSGRC